ncbi:DNA polymerase eta [Mycena indigotica]|uniref:DNA polymerase eta n=1 Tax=Mycena indigotica TaxID=2126181 RepID=A0A8H6T758_9AGAR|nr:DNA polymerase eta [Mycena indigotica]KAF7312150.1 DNA polymerase eta [Mycena indigotica]
MRPPSPSIPEKDFLFSALKQSLRIDGRLPLEMRIPELRFGPELGYVECAFGKTRVIAQVEAKMAKPTPERPFEGIVSIYSELSPMASAEYETLGRASEEEITITRMLDKVLRRSDVLDKESLCVIAGQRVWHLKVTIHCLSDAGNMLDCACLAGIVALKQYRIPDVEVIGEDVTIYPASERAPIPLAMNHTPFCFTFAFFPDSQVPPVLDPSQLEQRLNSGLMSVALNAQKELIDLRSHDARMLLMSATVPPNSTSTGTALFKGKAKAIPPAIDFNDLSPALTYRTILSGNLGTRDPLRVIALCDSDAFYAGCEMARLNIFDKPLVVLQWTLLIAVNYIARKYGITRMMSLKEAKERCPELIVVHVATYKEGEEEPGYWENPDTRTHKVSLDFYRRESIKILHMYKEGLPENTEIEKASIDEAFFDLTRPVRQILLHRYPYLGQVPEDAPLGPDTPLPSPPQDSMWHEMSTIIPITPSLEPPVEEKPTTWHDIALSIGAELMHDVRTKISGKLNYTTSAGIARNKFLAKLCASHRKPMGQTILQNDAIPHYILPLQFQKIRFLGGKLGLALADEYDVSTVADLLRIPLETIQQRFGESSIWVYQVIRGIDYSEVKEKTALNKSMLAAKNLPEPITKLSDGYQWIRMLSAELALRLNEARQTTPNLWPKTIVLHARNLLGDGRRSKQAPWPFVRDVTVDVIANAADRLWRELVNPHGPIKVTSVSLAFTGIEGVETGLAGIDTFFNNKPVSKRSRDDEVHFRGNHFVCGRCGYKASLPPSATRSEPERESALMSLKMEHDDFHVALDLSKNQDNHDAPSSPPKKKKKKKKSTPESSPQGIAKFFNRTI